MAKSKWFACIRIMVAVLPLLLATAPSALADPPPGGCTYFVRIDSPANGSKFLTGCFPPTAPVTIVASICSQTNVTISRVDFLANGVVIGSDTTAAYSIDWNAPAGNHTLEAKAYGQTGNYLDVSAPVSITVSTLNCSAPGFSASDFQFTVNGSPGVSADVQTSPDLINWTTIATVTLNGSGSYTYLDTSAGSLSKRFYRAQQSGKRSCNAVGFIKKNLLGNAQYSSVANQLNNTGGNTLSVLFPGLPVDSQVLIYSTASQNYTTANKGSSGWSPNSTLNPGQGAYVRLPSGASAQTIAFVGEVPEGTLVNSDIPTTPGNYSVISSIVPVAGTLDALGFPKREGDNVLKWNETSQSYDIVGEFVDNEWFPETPAMQIGESFWLQSGSSDVRAWTEVYSSGK